MSVFRRLRFLIVDWWQSAGEHRPIQDDSMRAVRDASHVNRGTGGRTGERHMTELAAEAGERYRRSFEKD